MPAGQTRITASISNGTKARLRKYAKARGLTMAQLVEEALLRHLQALNELPLDPIIPLRLVVTRECCETIAEQIRKPRRPTKAMRDLGERNAP